MQIELRKFKAYPARSEETLNFTADFFVDGRRAGCVENDGRGGSCHVLYVDAKVREAVRAHIATLPPEESPYGPLTMDEDFFFATLADKALRAQDEARAARKRARYAMDARVRGMHAFVGRFKAGADEYEVLLALKTDDVTVARAEVEKSAARKKGAVTQVERISVAAT